MENRPNFLWRRICGNRKAGGGNEKFTLWRKCQRGSFSVERDVETVPVALAAC